MKNFSNIQYQSNTNEFDPNSSSVMKNKLPAYIKTQKNRALSFFVGSTLSVNLDVLDSSHLYPRASIVIEERKRNRISFKQAYRLAIKSKIENQRVWNIYLENEIKPLFISIE